MGKASRTKQDSDRRARIAQQREAQRRAEQRKRIYLAGGSILVVAIVVIALVLVKLNSGSPAAVRATARPAPPSRADQAGHRRPHQRHRQGRGRRRRDGPVRLRGDQHRAQQRVDAARVLLRHRQQHAAHVGRQARGAVPGRRVLPVLRHPTLGDGQRPEPLRHLHRPDDHALVEHRRRPEHAHLHVLQVDVHEQLHQLHRGRGVRGSLEYHDSCRPRRPPSRPLAQTYDPERLRSPSSTSATSTSRSATCRRSPDAAGRQDLGPGRGRHGRPDVLALGKAEIGNANYMTAAICKLTNNLPATACTPTIQGAGGRLRQLG